MALMSVRGGIVLPTAANSSCTFWRSSSYMTEGSAGHLPLAGHGRAFDLQTMLSSGSKAICHLLCIFDEQFLLSKVPVVRPIILLGLASDFLDNPLHMDYNIGELYEKTCDIFSHMDGLNVAPSVNRFRFRARFKPGNPAHLQRRLGAMNEFWTKLHGPVNEVLYLHSR